jgi:hypothetical protein
MVASTMTSLFISLKLFRLAQRCLDRFQPADRFRRRVDIVGNRLNLG